MLRIPRLGGKGWCLPGYLLLSHCFLYSISACLLFISTLSMNSCHSGERSPLLRTGCGDVEGITWNGGVDAWLGIPYARPPVGELRWKAPRDPEPWSGVLEADEFGSECMQYGGMLLDLELDTFGEIMGSEDCLYLNLWRPRSHKEKMPVFFWIHGGMNIVGEAATNGYHGANLAEASNAVVVTFNYRLGPLGWFRHNALSVGDPLDDSGNYGILDIIKALEWVRENIEAFGGDPSNVTIAGESAGGFNVVSLLASPLARGLFHRAIAMSPATSLFSSSMEEGHTKAETALLKLLINDLLAGNRSAAGRLLGEKESDWAADYLRSKSAEEILSTSTLLSSFGLNEIGLTTDAFSGSRFEDGTVIPLGFSTRFLDGDYNQVPFIIGSNAEEMKIFEFAFGIISDPDENEVLDLILSFDPDDPDVALAEIVPPLLQPAYQAIGTFLGDAFFQGTGVDPLAEHMSIHQDVYVYKFAWDEQPAPFDFLIGASHMTGVPFFFGNFHTDERSMFRFAWSRENLHGRIALAEAAMRYTSGFMSTGDPNDGNPDLPVWKPWSGAEGRPKRIILDAELYMSD